MMMRRPVSAGALSTTDKSADITISSDGNTATATVGTMVGVRGVTMRNSGSVSFIAQFTGPTSVGTIYVGVGPSSQSFTSITTPPSWLFLTNGGNKVHDTTNLKIMDAPALAVNEYVKTELSFSTGQIRWYRSTDKVNWTLMNYVSRGNPAFSSVSGNLYITVLMTSSSGKSVTIDASGW